MKLLFFHAKFYRRNFTSGTAQKDGNLDSLEDKSSIQTVEELDVCDGSREAEGHPATLQCLVRRRVHQGQVG